MTRTFTLAVTLAALACGTAAAPGSNTTPIACVPGDADVPSGTSLSSENTAGTCPSAPVALVGVLAPGSACTMDSDCAPSCCACGTKGTSALVASCAGGFCASVNQLCCGYSATATCM